MVNFNNKQTYELKYLIIIEPLGFLYGSAGRFLSPENLVGRSGANFPPSSATVSGIFASTLPQNQLNNLCIAGAFWGKTDEVITNQNFYVPTPLNYLVKNNQIVSKLNWYDHQKGWFITEKGKAPNDKFDQGTWIPINDWENPSEVKKAPWLFNPHLHPRLALDQRRVYLEDKNTPADEKKGSLFLENAVQMPPDTCLIYLSSHELTSGWYRFGGEGHLVEITCKSIAEHSKIRQLLDAPINDQFALITPAIWGSNRLSYRFPVQLEKGNSDQYHKTYPDSNNQEVWSIKSIFTSRPYPYRYRLGNHDEPRANQPKLLSRGRYAVPAGTIYVLKSPLFEPWLNWNESWFPQEGVSLKRWGCGLSLPV